MDTWVELNQTMKHYFREPLYFHTPEAGYYWLYRTPEGFICRNHTGCFVGNTYEEAYNKMLVPLDEE